jgi:hypothetical protein
VTAVPANRWLVPTPRRGSTSETFEIPPPEGVTLDDVPMISICYLPGVDFLGNGNLGDGVFQDPLGRPVGLSDLGPDLIARRACAG